MTEQDKERIEGMKDEFAASLADIASLAVGEDATGTLLQAAMISMCRALPELPVDKVAGMMIDVAEDACVAVQARLRRAAEKGRG